MASATPAAAMRSASTSALEARDVRGLRRYAEWPTVTDGVLTVEPG